MAVLYDNIDNITKLRIFNFHFIQVTLISAIVEAKEWPETILHNRNVCREWRDGLIEICDEAISGFDVMIHDGSTFVNWIRSEITMKNFRTDLSWRVIAYVKKDFEANNDKYSLKLKYNNLSIEMSAN